MMGLFRKRQPRLEIVVTLQNPAKERLRFQRTVRDRVTILIPADLMFSAWRQLFPAERMVIGGGHETRSGVVVTSLTDVTEAKPSAAHVKSAPERLGQALIDFERTGAHLAVWIHSHPGEGPRATYPSDTDLNQDRDLRQHYSNNLLGIIVVRDGWLRVFGEAVTHGRLQVRFRGTGVEPTGEDRDVFRLTLS